MVVQHNLTAMNSSRNLGITTGLQAKSTEKLSSGYKINRAADDAAGLAISEKMRRQIRGLSQASANAQDGISLVQTAEGALNEVTDMLQRMNELSVKASSGTMTTEDCGFVDAEVTALKDEITRIGGNTTFNEKNLLDGTLNTSVQVGSEAGQTIAISAATAITETGLSIGSVSCANTTSASSSIATVKAALTTVSTTRSNLGAVQNRLEHTINNLDNVVENTTAAESAIRDTDMAAEMVKYSNNNILTQAGQAMLAQANQANAGVLALLQ